MKTGDFISRSDLIQQGFYLSQWFAGFIVYKRSDESGDNTYIFYDFWKNQIQAILISKQ